MTTTDLSDGAPSASPPRHRLLRRSATDRVGAGVAGGLGEYFGVDPVLFRVLFATSAFFGGAGIVAYLLAWAAIPERGTERAPIDEWVGELRRRHIPPWVMLVVSGVLLWAIAFSWWAPGPFVPVVAVVVILIAVFGRREWQAGRDSQVPAVVTSLSSSTALQRAQPVRLTKDAGHDATRTSESDRAGQARAWITESRSRHRARRRRAMPVRIATLVALVMTLGTLAIVNSVTAVQIQTYFWTGLGILAGGLVVGVVLRRTPWSITPLLVLFLAGCIAFAGSLTQFGDGIGHRQWRPTATSSDTYRLGFGEAVLDLRSLDTGSDPGTFHVRLGAGRVKIIAPPTMNLTVNADVHIGTVRDTAAGHFGPPTGVEFQRTVLPPPDAVGLPITVDVGVTDGEVTVDNLD